MPYIKIPGYLAVEKANYEVALEAVWPYIFGVGVYVHRWTKDTWAGSRWICSGTEGSISEQYSPAHCCKPPNQCFLEMELISLATNCCARTILLWPQLYLYRWLPWINITVHQVIFNITILCGGDMSKSVILRKKPYKLWFIAKSELKNQWKVPRLGNTNISFQGKKLLA